MTELKEEQVVGTLFSDCPDRDHDPYRMAGKPCHLCTAKAKTTIDHPRQKLLTVLREATARLKAENEQLQKKIDEERQRQITEIARFKQEIARLQEEIRKAHMTSQT